MTTAIMVRKRYLGVLVLLTVFVLAGCRGTTSSEPPVHVVYDMDFQNSYNPQEASDFFADGRAMRRPPEGTVARGYLRSDSAYYRGQTPDGGFVETIPSRVEVDRAFMERGQRQFNIYCTPCHGQAGDGQGIVTTGGYGMTPAPTFHSDYLRNQPDGYLYNVITNGIRTMPAYSAQVSVSDRWAIVAYIRALQRSQHASKADLPSGALE